MKRSSPSAIISTPNRRKASGMMPRLRSDTSLMRMPSPIIAAMPMNEPTSIMSGSILCSAPPSDATPSMVSRLLPMPEMCAPILFSMVHSCCMYGSQAALYIVVVPSASTAAMMMFAVPVTLASSSSIYVPLRELLRCLSPAFSSGSACISYTLRLSLNSKRAPRFLNPRKWVSRRRRPILSPPGSATTALPKRASSGPIMSTEPRRAEHLRTKTSLPR